MTTTPTAVGEKDDGVSVSQSGSALHGAPSGSEPSGAEAFLRFCARYFSPSRRHELSDKELLSVVEFHPALQDVLNPVERGEPAKPVVDVDATKERMRRRNEQMLSKPSPPTQPVPAAKSESHNHSEKGT